MKSPGLPSLAYAGSLCAALASQQPTSHPNAQPAKPPPVTGKAAWPGHQLLVVNAANATVSFLGVMHADGTLADGRVLASVPVGEGPRGVAVSSDSRRAVVANYGGEIPGSTLTVLDTDRHAVVRTIPLRQRVLTRKGPETREYLHPHCIRFRADDRTVVVACEGDGVVLEVDTDTGRIDNAYPPKSAMSEQLAIDHRSRTVFVDQGSTQGLAIALDKLDKRGSWRSGLASRLNFTADPHAFAVHPLRRELWVTYSAQNTIGALDTDSHQPIRELSLPGRPAFLAFAPDGQHLLASCSDTDKVAVIDLAHYDRVRMVALGKQSTAGRILVDPSGRFGFVTDSTTKSVHRIDIAQATRLGALDLQHRPAAMGWIVAPTARKRDPAQIWLASVTSSPVRPYYTTDFSRNRVADGCSTILEAGRAESIIQNLQAEVPAGFVVFLGNRPMHGFTTDLTKLEVVVAPGHSKWDILRRARTNAINFGHNNAQLIQLLRTYDALVPLRFTHASTDYVQADLDATDPDFPKLMRMAYDDCSSGGVAFGNVEEWAAEVKRRGSIDLWWD